MAGPAHGISAPTPARHTVVGGRSGAGLSDRLTAHDALKEGLPASRLVDLVESTALFSAMPGALEAALGVSLRTIQRRRRDGETSLLSPDQSSRLWKFAEILDRATEVFGGRDAAEAWLSSPAMALDRRRPIDLLATAAGTEAVETVLTRLDFGVYT